MNTDICGRPLVPGTEAYNSAERTGMMHYAQDSSYNYIKEQNNGNQCNETQNITNS